MAAAKRAWCSGSNDFNVVAADSGSERPPCLPSDSRMAEAAKRRRLAEVFDELDDVSSDSCWSSTSESSSSSSDDDDEVYAAAFQQLFSLPERRPKVEAYVTKTVASYSDEEFKRNFRVTRPVVDFLAAEFAKSPHCPQNSDHGGLPAKSAEEHILSFLWYAANKACIRDVAGRFEVAESTHHRMMGRVTAFLLDIAPNVIKFPSDLQKLAVDFEKLSGFPDTIGCVDGSYMPIRCPARKVRSVYINRHHYLSLTLQGVCDNKKRFLDASTGYPSKIHDARIFRRSRISSVLPQLCSSKYHIVGDAAYPFREYLMTPIRDYGNLDSIKKTFNARLSGTRVLIENTFGDLKNRFRQLHRLDMWTVDNMSKFIISCCVLHNLCIDCGDLPENLSRDLSLTSQTTNVDSSSSAVQVSSSSVAQQDSLLRGLASIKRDHLMIKMGLQNQQP
nr:putative nuclease HARBI1 [Rhipicephalus microplus]XP_037284460.1 putative nuclease HARBI1 [Rhipicephalus microplus]XP_037287810.1 putative nuclease HARBI1 [Rhipicephalus microplus]XP_037289140.1 putative nuclease HARBI1 [Rhipicephalus microplus]